MYQIYVFLSYNQYIQKERSWSMSSLWTALYSWFCTTEENASGVFMVYLLLTPYITVYSRHYKQKRIENDLSPIKFICFFGPIIVNITARHHPATQNAPTENISFCPWIIYHVYSLETRRDVFLKLKPKLLYIDKGGKNRKIQKLFFSLYPVPHSVFENGFSWIFLVEWGKNMEWKEGTDTGVTPHV